MIWTGPCQERSPRTSRRSNSRSTASHLPTPRFSRRRWSIRASPSCDGVPSPEATRSRSNGHRRRRHDHSRNSRIRPVPRPKNSNNCRASRLAGSFSLGTVSGPRGHARSPLRIREFASWCCCHLHTSRPMGRRREHSPKPECALATRSCVNAAFRAWRSLTRQTPPKPQTALTRRCSRALQASSVSTFASLTAGHQLGPQEGHLLGPISADTAAKLARWASDATQFSV